MHNIGRNKRKRLRDRAPFIDEVSHLVAPR
jgi:hypothetical protein